LLEVRAYCIYRCHVACRIDAILVASPIVVARRIVLDHDHDIGPGICSGMRIESIADREGKALASWCICRLIA
jgi:hypothetical protein